MRKEITYYYRGPIERRTWVEGYSRNGDHGGILYPWSTKRECQSEARHYLKGKAVFIRDGKKIN